MKKREKKKTGAFLFPDPMVQLGSGNCRCIRKIQHKEKQTIGISEELLRMQRDMDGQPELKEKLEAEISRILESGEAENEGTALVKAAAALGYAVTQGEADRFTAGLEELDTDEMAAVSGGFLTGCTNVFVCSESYFFDGKPRIKTKPIRTNPIRTIPFVKKTNKRLP